MNQGVQAQAQYLALNVPSTSGFKSQQGLHKERTRGLQESDFTVKELMQSLMHLETQHTISLKESGSDPLADLGESL